MISMGMISDEGIRKAVTEVCRVELIRELKSREGRIIKRKVINIAKEWMKINRECSKKIWDKYWKTENIYEIVKRRWGVEDTSWKKLRITSKEEGMHKNVRNIEENKRWWEQLEWGWNRWYKTQKGEWEELEELKMKHIKILTEGIKKLNVDPLPKVLLTHILPLW